MTYLLLSLAFAAGALALVVTVWLTVPGRRALLKRWWFPLVVALVLLIVLTAIFDNLMIHANLITYHRAKISGVMIGRIPIEDFFYPAVGVFLVPALWLLARKRTTARGSRALRFLFRASRPISWINTAFPFAAAYLLSTRHIDVTVIVGTIFFLVPYNLAMYGINDVFDYESDIRNPRKGGVEGALLGREVHRTTLMTSVLLPIPFVVYLVASGSILSACVLAGSLFFVAAYSVPGLRFKEIPFLDSITSSIHFVSPAVYGLVLAGAVFTPGLWLIIGAFFLWGMGSHAFGAVQDVVPDREGGISSIATVLSAAPTVRFAIGAWALGGLAMVFTPWPGPLAALLAVPYIVAAFPYWSVSDADSGHVHRGWQKFLWINYACGFVVTLLLIAQAWR